jgi:hypothetical protein
MIWEDPDAELRRLAEDANFRHRDAARRAVRFRVGGNVADLIAVLDDPHPCGMTEIVFAVAGTARPWLNWVPMPSEASATWPTTSAPGALAASRSIRPVPRCRPRSRPAP